MDSPSLFKRRLLLGRFAAGAPVFGTFLLPASLHAAIAHSHPREPDGHGQRAHDQAGHDQPGHKQPAHKQPAHARHGHGSAGHDKQLPGTHLAEPAKPVPLIMLDPGHGGKDPGAIGVSGTYEKHISLLTALELKRQLEAGGRYRVELTRAHDVFVPLDGRVEAAQRHRAALFVSMHADALSDHAVRGASVYTLAPTASDTLTAALATRENAADHPGRNHRHATTPAVQEILANLVRVQTRSESLRLARGLVQSLDQDLPMLPNPERSAGFTVLKAAAIPSVLVEMGFMSNPHDEAMLRRADHRRLVARAMQRAVDAYFTGLDRVASTGLGVG
ncbi:MAG TPA: N-acetylmuramoyl-L-alanine amidase [Rhodopila sp.]|nr:N-acetylmuramoyl-L-alanine amidase [Rhodopila sp.]